MQKRNNLPRTLSDLEKLGDSDFIKSQVFEDFSFADLKKLSSDDLRGLYQKKIKSLMDQFLKTKEKLPNEEVTRFEQGEIKKFTKVLTQLRDKCLEAGLSVREFEEEAVNFITDKYKRFFFGSKIAKGLYKFNNGIASTSFGYWGYRAVGALGTTNRFLLPSQLSKSLLPIAYFTGVTCRFWAYITSPLPAVSKAFDGLSHIAMSPIWLVEFAFNKLTAPLWKLSPLKVPIPLNITGEVASGSGLTWDKLTHTFEFVKNMTQTWEIPIPIQVVRDEL